MKKSWTYFKILDADDYDYDTTTTIPVITTFTSAMTTIYEYHVIVLHLMSLKPYTTNNIYELNLIMVVVELEFQLEFQLIWFTDLIHSFQPCAHSTPPTQLNYMSTYQLPDFFSRILMVLLWYIGILVYWYIGILVYWWYIYMILHWRRIHENQIEIGKNYHIQLINWNWSIRNFLFATIYIY